MINNKTTKSRRQGRTVLLVIVFFILGLAVSFVFQKFRSSKPAEPSIPKNALLSLTTDREKVASGQEFTVTLNLDSSGSEVAAADFVIRFDPEFVKVVSVTTGSFFNNYPVNITANDHVRLSGVATFDGNTLILPKGSGPVGYIKFQALQTRGSAVISIDKVKTVVATAGQDILDRKTIKKLDVDVI